MDLSGLGSTGRYILSFLMGFVTLIASVFSVFIPSFGAEDYSWVDEVDWWTAEAAKRVGVSVGGPRSAARVLPNGD